MYFRCAAWYEPSLVYTELAKKLCLASVIGSDVRRHMAVEAVLEPAGWGLQCDLQEQEHWGRHCSQSRVGSAQGIELQQLQFGGSEQSQKPHHGEFFAGFEAFFLGLKHTSSWTSYKNFKNPYPSEIFPNLKYRFVFEGYFLKTLLSTNRMRH